MKTGALKRDLNEIKNSMSEINDLALGRNVNGVDLTMSPFKQSAGDVRKVNAMNNSSAIKQLKKQIRSSIENLVDDNTEPLVTFPDADDNPHNLSGRLDMVHGGKNQLGACSKGMPNKTIDTVKFDEKRTITQSKTKVVTDGYSSENASSNMAESKRLQTSNMDYQEAMAAAAIRNTYDIDGIKTENNAAVIEQALSFRTSDFSQQSSNNVAAASIKVQSDTFSADKKAITQSQQMQTMRSNGIISQEKHVSTASHSNFTMTHKGVSSSGSSMISSSSQMSTKNNHLIKLSELKLDDLQALSSSSEQCEIDEAINKYSNVLKSLVNTLQDSKAAVREKSLYLDKINEVMRRAWAVPTHGHELGYSLCNSLRINGGLDLLMKNCVQNDIKIKISSAQLLEQCLTTENRTHVVEYGLDKVVNVACVCTKNPDTVHSRIGTGILEHLFKHSEETCSKVIKLGGLDAVLFECRTNDIETLRHCASALANLSLYGGAENQEAMIKRKVPMWLFPLAFHDDDNIKYYACLAIAVLVANKEIEAEVLKSGCLDLVEPFVTSHDPYEFAKSNLSHAHGQSKHWLERLVPVLNSNREEARNLAAFHFCMEAGIKKEQNNTEIFQEIGAIEALKTVASCPNGNASKFAAQALRHIGETVPHKLSQKVPLWSVPDVKEWVKQIGFAQFVKQFEESQVDGDLLLKLTEENLRDDIGISNGILLKRFERELQNLKRMADYSSKDTAKISDFLSKIGPEYCTYTYSMLNAGIDNLTLPQLNEDMLIAECGIKNSIHRLRILSAVKNLENSLPNSSEENMAKTLDVFVSYRRSNGSQLASLLKVHLQLRGFSVFIDVERLEAGKFDNGLLNSISQAKNFVLVLTPNALERCVNDQECKDWVHREIVAALKSNCNIIPIIDQQFKWPDTEKLPEDMRTVCHFNGVSWIHDYQDACIDKLERFLRGEKNIDRITTIPSSTTGPPAVTYQRMHSNDSDFQTPSTTGSCCGNGSMGTVGSNNGDTAKVAGQAPSHQSNKYRQSNSPGREHMGVGSNSRIFPYPINTYDGSKRNNMLPAYRTQQMSRKPIQIGDSTPNVVPVSQRNIRRSSAAGINNEPFTFQSVCCRSQSADGLLDMNVDNNPMVSIEQNNAEINTLVAAAPANALQTPQKLLLPPPLPQPPTSASGVSVESVAQPFETQSMASSLVVDGSDIDDVQRRENTISTNPQHRKSKSLDHFLTDGRIGPLSMQAQPLENTQSMQELASALDDQTFMNQTNNYCPKADAANDKCPLQITLSNEFDRSTNDLANDNFHHNDPTTQTRTTTACPDHQSKARQSHQGPNKLWSTNGANNKTIFNRTLKKVRSLIKK